MTIVGVAKDDINVTSDKVVDGSIFPEDPLHRWKVAVKHFVSVLHVLSFDIKFSLEGRYVVLGDVCSKSLEATYFVVITMGSHGSDIVRLSAVVYTGSERCTQEVAGEIEHPTMSPISVYEGIKCIFDLFGVETGVVFSS